MSVRLPTVGAHEDVFGPAGAVRPAGDRRPVGRPVFSLVAAASTVSVAPLAEALVRELLASGFRPAGLAVRRAPGECGVAIAGEDDPLVEAGASPVVRVRVDPARTEAALGQAWEWLPAGQPVVATGNDVPALYRPSLTVLVSGGLGPAAWAPSARVLRDRLDVELSDARPGFGRALACHWIRRAVTAGPRLDGGFDA